MMTPPIRLRVNGHDLGNIKGQTTYSREAIAETVGDFGITYRLGNNVELLIDTDSMLLAEIPPDVMEQLAFAKQMIDYLQSAQSQHGNKPVRPQCVPSRIRLLHDLRGDFPFGHMTFAPAGEHDCMSNQWGAISVKAQDGNWLGVKPDEREILKFCRNPHLE